jgi:replicative DNA helicase
MPPDERTTPHSRDAERCLLGSMLRDNAVIGDVLQIVRLENFYFDAHQKIFQGITSLYDKAHPVDLVTLAEWLREQKYIEDIGGYAYLGELWESAPTAANAEYYARIVRDKAIVRNLITAGTEILRDAYDQAQPADELLEASERKILDVAQLGITGQTATLVEAMGEAFDRIDARTQKDYVESGLPTGYLDIDEMTAGLHNSELIILAARPSVGKTAMALNICRNVVVGDSVRGVPPVPVFFVSLEQSRVELAERLLCAQARVDSHKLRKGHLSSDDMDKLIKAGDVLRQTRLFIDDTPAQGMLRIAANARRLKKRHDIRLVVIDYLQLIDPDNKRDSRQEQVAQISRRLKFLARELKVPVLALAQVNRSSEDRQDHRPRLADLRESGCLAGDTLVTLADTGERVPIRDLVGRKGFNVWALDELTWRLKPAEVTNAFATGRKPVFRLETRLGRVVRATANHKFRAFDGWRRLDELQPGDRIALPRIVPTCDRATLTDAEAALLGQLIGDGCTLPRHAIQYTTREDDLAETVAELARTVFGERVEPRIKRERQWYQVYLAVADRLTHGKRNPVAEWLDGLGVFGLRSHEKRVPEVMFRQPAATVAVFLRHLWVTDGCIRPPSGKSRHPTVYYASSSERLARDVQELLTRIGISGVLREYSQGAKGRPQWHVTVMGRTDLLTFAEVVGTVGRYKSAALAECRAWLVNRSANTNRDVIPRAVWRSNVIPAMRRNGVTMRVMQRSLGMQFAGAALYKTNVSRTRLARVAEAAGGDSFPDALAASDVYWDEVTSVTPDGEEEAFDLTVPGPANFIANSIYAHNSIEQDADTVLLLHRPGKYEGGQEDNVIEVLVAKQRNGPTGDVTLAYLKQYMRYENYAVGGPTGIDL